MRFPAFEGKTNPDLAFLFQPQSFKAFAPGFRSGPFLVILGFGKFSAGETTRDKKPEEFPKLAPARKGRDPGTNLRPG